MKRQKKKKKKDLSGARLYFKNCFFSGFTTKQLSQMFELILSDLNNCINNPTDSAIRNKLETTLLEGVKKSVTDATFR